MIREIVIAFISSIFPIMIGFELGHFYSQQKFEQIYRDGFEKGYFLGRADKGDRK